MELGRKHYSTVLQALTYSMRFLATKVFEFENFYFHISQKKLILFG